MSVSQARSRRKKTGARYKSTRSKKHHECGRPATKPRIGERKSKLMRGRGGRSKEILLRADEINLMDPKTRKCTKAKIKTVADNPANRNFIRANILTKGTVVDTDKGRARVTNRPGQEGTVNGVLV